VPLAALLFTDFYHCHCSHCHCHSPAVYPPTATATAGDTATASATVSATASDAAAATATARIAHVVAQLPHKPHVRVFSYGPGDVASGTVSATATATLCHTANYHAATARLCHCYLPLPQSFATATVGCHCFCCQAATATAMLPLFIHMLCRLAQLYSDSILVACQNDRNDLGNPFPLLPRNHCHYVCHCHSYTDTAIHPLPLPSIFQYYIDLEKKKKKSLKLPKLPKMAYLAQYCPSQSLFYTKMTASTSSFQRYHCHPTTATLSPTITVSVPAECGAAAGSRGPAQTRRRSQQWGGVQWFLTVFNGVLGIFDGFFWCFEAFFA
jgi:hypothetical protein